MLRGREWKTVRGHYTPLLTFVKLKQYFPTIRTVCAEMVQFVKTKWEERGSLELETKKVSFKCMQCNKILEQSDLWKIISIKIKYIAITQRAVFQFSGKYTTDVIANAILGIKNNSFQEECTFVGEIIKKMFTNDIKDNLKYFLVFVFPMLAPLLKLRCKYILSSNYNLYIYLTKIYENSFNI